MMLFSNYNITNILNSGQVFSFEPYEDGFKVYSADKCCVAVPDGDDTIVYCYDEDLDYWYKYFNVEIAHKASDLFSKSDNKFIKMCSDYANGMTILKQDIWEMICSYIISQRNNIPAIKGVLQKIRMKFGEKRYFNVDKYHFEFYTFPTAEQLRDITIQDLQGLSLGYRDKYIMDAIKWWHNTDINKLIHKNRDEHLEALKEIKGVGIKVANCISLFAFNDFECFPIDVWIQRVLDKKLVTNEDIEKYWEYAGFLNQIIYFYCITHKEEISK